MEKGQDSIGLVIEMEHIGQPKRHQLLSYSGEWIMRYRASGIICLIFTPLIFLKEVR